MGTAIMRRFSGTWRIVLVVCWSAALVLATMYYELPHGGGNGEPGETDFSVARAGEYLKQIAIRPHPHGSLENARVSYYIANELKQLGLEPQVKHFDGILHYKYLDGPVVLDNVMAVLPGSGGPGRKALMMSAHYDSVQSGPGANDDGVSVASLLETVRALKDGPPLKNDIWFVFTDAEENRLWGMAAFLTQEDVRSKVGLAINFEARGSEGPSMMFQTGAGNEKWVREYARSAPHPVANSFMVDVYKKMPNDTDLSPVLELGVPGMNIAYLGGWETYHSRIDDLKHVHAATFRHQGENALAVARRFGDMDLEKLRGSQDAVYFNAFGKIFLYPSRYNGLIAAALAVFGVLMTVWSARSGAVRLKDVFVNILMVLPVAAVSVGLSLGGWRLIEAAWGSRITASNGAILGRAWYDGGFLAVSAAVYLLFRGTLRRSTNTKEALAAGYWIWMVLLILCVGMLPGAVYLFALPLVPAGLAWILAMVRPSWESGWRKTAAYLAVSFVPVILWTSVFHLLFDGLPPFVDAMICPVFMSFLTALVGPWLGRELGRGRPISSTGGALQG